MKLLIMISFVFFGFCSHFPEDELVKGDKAFRKIQTILYLRNLEFGRRKNQLPLVEAFWSILPIYTPSIYAELYFYKKDLDRCLDTLLIYPFSTEQELFLIYIYGTGPLLCKLEKQKKPFYMSAPFDSFQEN